MIATKTTAAEIAEQHGGYIHNVARRMLRNEHDAEDVLQEVLKIVVRKIHTFQGNSNVRTWLYRVTFNKCVEFRQRAVKLAERECPCAEIHELVLERPVDEEMLVNEEKAVIKAAVSKLPPDFKQVLVMSHFDDMSNAEIGEKLELSLPAVKSRLHRARRRMCKLLRPYYM